MRSPRSDLLAGKMTAESTDHGGRKKSNEQQRNHVDISVYENGINPSNYIADSDKEADLRELVDTREESWIGPFFTRRIA